MLVLYRSRSFRDLFAPRKAGVLILSFLWILGFATGFLFLDLHNEQISLLTRECFAQPVSLLGLVSVWLIPFAVFRFCFSCGYSIPLYVLSFIRSYFLGVCLKGVCAAFGSASWLVFPLLFCSALFSNFFYLALSFLFFTVNDASVRRFFVWTILVSVLIFLVDLCFISPFCTTFF